jgi:hypothetical protein
MKRFFKFQIEEDDLRQQVDRVSASLYRIVYDGIPCTCPSKYVHIRASHHFDVMFMQVFAELRALRDGSGRGDAAGPHRVRTFEVESVSPTSDANNDTRRREKHGGPTSGTAAPATTGASGGSSSSGCNLTVKSHARSVSGVIAAARQQTQESSAPAYESHVHINNSFRSTEGGRVDAGARHAMGGASVTYQTSDANAIRGYDSIDGLNIDGEYTGDGTSAYAAEHSRSLLPLSTHAKKSSGPRLPRIDGDGNASEHNRTSTERHATAVGSDLTSGPLEVKFRIKGAKKAMGTENSGIYVYYRLSQ